MRSNSVTASTGERTDSVKGTTPSDPDKGNLHSSEGEATKATVGNLSSSLSTPVLQQSSSASPVQDTEMDLSAGYGFHEYVRLKRENRTLKLQVRDKFGGNECTFVCWPVD